MPGLRETLPDWLEAFEDSDWRYYVPVRETLDDSFGAIGYPDEFDYEQVWMRPVRASSLDYYDGSLTVHNPKTGRFEPVMCWIECSESTDGAVPFYGARYK